MDSQQRFAMGHGAGKSGIAEGDQHIRRVGLINHTQTRRQVLRQRKHKHIFERARLGQHVDPLHRRRQRTTGRCQQQKKYQYASMPAPHPAISSPSHPATYGLAGNDSLQKPSGRYSGHAEQPPATPAPWGRHGVENETARPHAQKRCRYNHWTDNTRMKMPNGG